MSNPTHCVVCRSQLAKTLRSRPAADPDAAEEGRFQTWEDERRVVEIFCPRCRLLYQVAEPREPA